MAKWVVKTPADYERAHKAIQDRMNKVVKGIKGAPLKAVIDVALDWLGRAVEKAPVETGDLRSSGYITVNGILIAHGNEDGSITALSNPSIPDSERNTVEIGFASAYAFVQHEHVEFNHPMGGQAKYLEVVIIERSAEARASRGAQGQVTGRNRCGQ